MLTDYVLKRALDEAIRRVRGLLRETNSALVSKPTEIEESLNYHLAAVENWSSEVSFSDLRKAKSVSDVYVDLDVYIQPQRLTFIPGETRSIPLDHIFNESPGHVMLLGHPGAGKTTSMKRLCQMVIHGDSFCSERFSFPILIRLRQLATPKGSCNHGHVTDELKNILALKMEFADNLKGPAEKTKRSDIVEKSVALVLDQLEVLLILDGFDELPSHEDREIVLREIRNLALHLTNATLVVTSRTGEFNYSIENLSQYELCELNKDQISRFAKKWLANETQQTQFLGEVDRSPFADAAIRPLTLAHLCAIYERIGKIPDKPKTVYRKIVNLFLEEWDQQRSVKRPSKYAGFEVDRKFEFLSHVAYALTTQLQTTVFSRQGLAEVYELVREYYDLERNEVYAVVNELESHTGLLLQSGYDSFEFAHKSLQEYLAAEHLVKLPGIPRELNLILIPNELAIATTISSIAGEYFVETSKRLLQTTLREDFLKTFLTRLVLEKPDFNTEPRITLFLFALYDCYLRNSPHYFSAQHARFHDQLRDDFENFSETLLRGNSAEIILTYYEIETTYSYLTKRREKMHIMRQRSRKEMKRAHQDQDGVSLSGLPQEILVRDRMLQHTSA